MASLIAAGTAIAAASSAGAATAATGLTFASVMTGVGALSTIASGVAAYQGGKASEEQMELQARQTEIQGRFDAISTNEELLKTLAMNNVAAAAGGLKAEGSVQRAQEASRAQAAEELNVQRYNVAGQAEAQRAKGAAAKSAGFVSLIGSTMTAGDSLAGALTTKRRTK